MAAQRLTRGGGLEGADIEAILLFAQNEEKCPANAAGEVEKISFMNDYAASLRDMICRGVNADDYERPLRGYHIVVDAGNGVGGFYAEKVLAPLGADMTGSFWSRMAISRTISPTRKMRPPCKASAKQRLQTMRISA